MSNAEYVTRDELKAHLDPMRADIKDIGVDVKTLLAAHIAASAIKVEGKDQGARKIAILAAAVSILGSLWWVPQALAHIN